VLAASQKYRTPRGNSSESCKNYGKNTHTAENCFSVHPEKLADFHACRAARIARGCGTAPTSRGSVSVDDASPVSAASSSWVLDLGTSFHVTSVWSQLVNCKPVADGASIQIADGTSYYITHDGSLCTSHFFVPDVSFVPQLAMNLLSVDHKSKLFCWI
jgi:hypothetical protein